MASWLSWVLPGAGHLYLGLPLVGILAFLVVEGLFFLGIKLSHGMVFEFLDADLRGPFAGALTPEVGNPLGLLYQMKSFGFGLEHPRPWPEHIHLGSWLMASSGMINVALVVHANFWARVPRSSKPKFLTPGAHVLAGWLVPGLGHFLQGRRVRGIVVFTMLVGMLVLGTVLAEGSNLDRERHFYYWSGQFLAGGPVMLLEALHGHAAVARDIAYSDAGLVFGCLAGLLNILCLLDVQAYGAERGLEALVPVDGVETVASASAAVGSATTSAATNGLGTSSTATRSSGTKAEGLA
jgi:TM2 domain-containing membrane protein YozV